MQFSWTDGPGSAVNASQDCKSLHSGLELPHRARRAARRSTAEDFHSAFGLSPDSTSIGTLDATGISMLIKEALCPCVTQCELG